MTGQVSEAVRAIPGIPYRFQRPELLREALTHRSRGAENYERLEFLGDSVLSLVVSRRLFERRPGADEGSLSRLRSKVVRGESLARMAQQLRLGEYLRMGPGELRSGGFRRQSVLADALEAVLGAIYLDGGFTACEQVIVALFDPLIEALPDAESLKDAKTRLQEWLQARARPLPRYRLEAETGADHAKRFRVACLLTDSGLEEIAEGTSRRRAEQAAAAAVLKRSQEPER